MRVLQRLRRGLRDLHRRSRGKRALRQALREGFPQVLFRATLTLITGKGPRDVRPSLQRVASIRRDIASRGEEMIPVFYSPKPGATEEVPGGRVRPKAGEVKMFSARSLALETSVPEDVGAFLHVCARDTCAETILELGSCVGVGSAYLASSPKCKRFVTIEASAPLAEIARDSLAHVTATGEVHTGLFCDALDELLPTFGQNLGMVWIDGHHEKLATLHYFELLRSSMRAGCVVLFDDIYWSHDMLRGWQDLRNRPGFSHSVDLGICGMGLWEGGSVTPREWDFRQFIRSGDWRPRQPAGW